jgi:hypothetical protein
MRIASLFVTAAALALSACASSESASNGGSSGADCFRPSQASGYTTLDDNRVRLRAGTNDYIVTIRGRTSDLDWSRAIAVESTQAVICPGESTLGLYLVGGEPRVRFAVSSVELVPDDTPAGS